MSQNPLPRFHTWIDPDAYSISCRASAIEKVTLSEQGNYNDYHCVCRYLETSELMCLRFRRCLPVYIFTEITDPEVVFYVTERQEISRLVKNNSSYDGVAKFLMGRNVHRKHKVDFCVRRKTWNDEVKQRN